MKIKKTEDTSKTFKTSEVITLVLITFLVSLSIGLAFGKIKVTNTIFRDKDDKALKEFINQYNYILDNYYEDVDKEQLISGAIKGMTEALDDDYSMYIEKEEGTSFNISLDGTYKGLGIEIYKKEENTGVIVSGIFKNSPAYKAGLQLGDVIVAINDQDVTKMSASEVSNYILYNDKDDFKVVVQRDGETLQYDITKEYIEIDSVTSKIYEKNNKKIGYIYISIFAANTDTQFKNNLDELEKEGIDSLIIDVRSNNGGHLTAVEGILDHLLTTNQIEYQMTKNDQTLIKYGRAKNNKNYQIALLADANSASASEVLVAGLKENLQCLFYGVKTFGKGTVQELKSLANGDQYKITTQKWLTPKGNWINDTDGIEPDVEVELSEQYFKTYQDKDDNQLQSLIKELAK